MANVRFHAHPGLFLVLEGPDGGGKTTQAERLAKWLDEGGFDVVTCRDPGGTALGDRLRSVLQDRTNMPVSMRAEMLLFMASRAQLVEEVIAPALAAAKIVISDRYLLSNIVYQGTAGGLLEEEIAMVGLAATAGLLPDLTIVLDITPEQSHARIARRGIGSRIARCSIKSGFVPDFWPRPKVRIKVIPNPIPPARPPRLDRSIPHRLC